MSATVAAASSVQSPSSVRKNVSLENLPFFDVEEVQHLMHTVPFPLSESYVLHRLSGRMNRLVCTKIHFVKKKFNPEFSVACFEMRADGQIHDLVPIGDVMRIGRQRWPNLTSVYEWAGPRDITGQIITINDKRLGILSHPACINISMADAARKSLARAPAGVFFIRHDPEMPLLGFMIYVQTDTGIQSHPLWIAWDGSLKVSGDEQTETFSSFGQIAAHLHLRQGLRSWETEEERKHSANVSQK